MFFFHDVTELILAKFVLPVAKGTADQFYPHQLLPENLVEASKSTNVKVTLRMQEVIALKMFISGSNLYVPSFVYLFVFLDSSFLIMVCMFCLLFTQISFTSFLLVFLNSLYFRLFL